MNRTCPCCVTTIPICSPDASSRCYRAGCPSLSCPCWSAAEGQHHHKVSLSLQVEPEQRCFQSFFGSMLQGHWQECQLGEIWGVILRGAAPSCSCWWCTQSDCAYFVISTFSIASQLSLQPWPIFLPQYVAFTSIGKDRSRVHRKDWEVHCRALPFPLFSAILQRWAHWEHHRLFFWHCAHPCGDHSRPIPTQWWFRWPSGRPPPCTWLLPAAKLWCRLTLINF